MAAEVIANALMAYAAVGFVFACAFVTLRVRQGGWMFRLMIVPGSAALWPVLFRQWVRAK